MKIIGTIARWTAASAMCVIVIGPFAVIPLFMAAKDAINSPKKET